ncbi:hypothetical protein, partial [Mycobacterium tuberculosis]|uniref:hypothetical protein n=1 Tax=Mycobacterium tuberculosis TaxID=1773 RepID=UPI001BE00F25
MWDMLYLSYYGVSPTGGFPIVLYLYHIIVFFGVAYLFQLYITEYLSGRFYYVAIRYRSLFKWF